MTAASSPEPRTGPDVAPLHHSYLYAPGSRPEVMRKALRAGADCVLLDLEDAVAATDKATARTAVAELLAELADTPTPPDDPGRPEVHVRINATADGFDPDDLAAVVGPGLSALRLPKAENPGHLADVARMLDELEGRRGMPVGSVGLYPLIESAAGVHHAVAVLAASPRVVRAALGTSDLLADLGIPEDTSEATLHLRSRLVLDSRVAGVGPPIDSVHTDLADLEGLATAARRARGLGFVGKSLIHPTQIEPTHQAFAPTDDEIAHAQAVVDRAHQGATRMDAQFIDDAVVARAQSLLVRHRASSQRTRSQRTP